MNGFNMSDVINYMFGSTQVSEVYFGSTKIWPKTPQHDYSQEYLTFESIDSNGSIITAHHRSTVSGSKIIEYSTDGTSWTSVTISEGSNIQLVSLANNEKMYVRGTNETFFPVSFNMSGDTSVYGNIMSIINKNTFKTLTTLTGYFNFSSIFSGDIVDAQNLVLPATTLTSNCYNYMFQGCTSLITAPSTLPATTLTSSCYYGMFRGCTSLITAPTLPATSLAYDCYALMFQGCTSLTTVPSILPATTLTERCYYGMFANCTSLTTVPVLPATTLSDYCYNNMFADCTSLTTAPVLPATTLSDYCYNNMFARCTSLTTAPALPATTLTAECYNNMFYGCTSLNSITCLATDISANSCTNNWLYGVAATGTFTRDANMTDWTTGASGIPSGWTVQNAS